MKHIYERLLAAASLRSADGAVRVSAEYEPTAGVGTPVFPPTVKIAATDGAGYLREERWVGGERTQVVLLDQRQSQANRCELGLLAAMERGEVFVPHLVLATEAEGVPVRMTSLEAPHRSRDAYFRDSVEGSGRAFDETEPGAALRGASSRDSGAFLRWVPTDLVYGVWDSHRKRRIQVKIPRAYTSEMVGLNPLDSVRGAGRVDPLNLTGETVRLTPEGGWASLNGEKAPKNVKTHRLSELGHGMVPASEGIGGVTVTSVQRSATVSMAQLASLRFGAASDEFTAAGRALVAALALLADRLAFAAPAIRLRSGCDLVLVAERLEWVMRGRDGRPATQPLELSTQAEALELFRIALERARATGLEWPSEPFVVRPTDELQKAIAKSFVLAGAGTAEGE
ncbi:type I-U CRISPR-associated RAMP protein Csb1/Cas7u [Streptomyces radicis]|uniref:Type I-U CRISPR-associated protein Cas7 n=1 Tax=Streptomyces radicis TaxID=1750517 RepID=A0A3A9VQA7_9ACTN|nr:type I-U CRISPR-associated RAMP protein Csb1/Cas7u [Streptomyces radicis]RKN03118.1 type I-U CRISPR-associated protein Cas7 [Streptomyces radicis]RKN13046.1 type I-U CRISPR-associated protein Cas7 [Streptomyces radicis]